MGGGEEAKLFVGGLSQETTKETLKNHFSQHGSLTDAVVMYDSTSGRSRGFGFVTFEKSDIIDSILSNAQMVDGKEVDCKRACPREVLAARQFGGQHYHGSQPSFKTNKIFVGGLPDLSTDEFKDYFSKYGTIVDAVLMVDKNTNRPRGFGFITYENNSIVDEVVRKYHDHQIKDKWVEVKKAQSKEQLGQARDMGPGGRGGGFGPFGGGAYGGGGYPGYYDGYRGPYPAYDHRRAFGAFDPYAGHPAYGGGGAFGPNDGGNRRPYSPYGPSRGNAAGGYRGAAGDPYGIGGGGGGGYNPQMGSGGAAYGGQPGGGASAYGAAYGGGMWTAGV